MTEEQALYFTQEMLTTAQAEARYRLPAGSVRRDIFRKKFTDKELCKAGHIWLITVAALDRQYGKRKDEQHGPK